MQRVGSRCRLHYMAAMQCKPPTLLTTPSSPPASPPPPPPQSKCRQTHLRSSCQKGVRRVGFNYLVAGRPLSPEARPVCGPFSANPSATHKKWHHFLVKRDERLPLLHIGPCYHARQSRYYRQYSDLSCSLSRLPDWALGPMARCSAIVPICVHSTRAASSATRPRVATSWLAISGRTVSQQVLRHGAVGDLPLSCPGYAASRNIGWAPPSLSHRRHPPPRAGEPVLRCHPPPPGPISSICPPQPPRQITHIRETTGRRRGDGSDTG